MTPEKMLRIHERMLDLHGLLKAEFGGQIGLTISGSSGPSSFPGVPPSMMPPPSINVTFVFVGDEMDHRPKEPPTCMSSFGGPRRNDADR